ncbi:MAG: Gfo/Idh/MocA family oxidoreductase, partial [Planctomycetota bacterium]
MNRKEPLEPTRLTRREALQRGAVALSAPLYIPREVLGGDGASGANERIGVGAIGVGNRARQLLEQLPGGARIVALSDCNLPRVEAFKAEKQAAWPIYQDHRRLLERADVDAVIVGTGEFQRIIPCIDACQAGKDIYAEKPLS